MCSNFAVANAIKNLLLPLVAKSKLSKLINGDILLTTDEHGFTRKHDTYILVLVLFSDVQWSKHKRGKMIFHGRYTNHG